MIKDQVIYSARYVGSQFHFERVSASFGSETQSYAGHMKLVKEVLIGWINLLIPKPRNSSGPDHDPAVAICLFGAAGGDRGCNLTPIKDPRPFWR